MTGAAASGTGAGIRIDDAVCIGAGQCMMTAPDVFASTDEGFSTLLPGYRERADPGAVRQAVLACPVQAIALEEEPS